MRDRHTTTRWLCWMVVLCLLPGGILASEERPDFTGSWVLNEELSENPRDKMRQSMGGGRSGGGGMGGGGRGGGSGMGGGGRGGGSGMGGGGRGGSMGGSGMGGDREAMRQRFADAAAKAARLEITQGEELSILYADGSLRVVPVDGEAGDIKSHWKGDRLVVELKGDGGRQIKETLQLAEDGARLHVTTRMSGDLNRPTISFLRVYDMAVAEETEEETPDE